MKLSPILLSGAFALAMALPVAGCAQQAPTQAPPASSTQTGRHHHGGMMRMLKGINLTDQQRTQVHQLTQQYRDKHPQGTAPDPAGRKALREQIMNVLTPDQQAQVKQNMSQMRERRAEPAPTASPA